MKINKIVPITILLSIAFFTSACNETKKVEESVEIHVQRLSMKSYSNSDPETQIYLDAAENFHKLNPQITVTIDYLPDIPPGDTLPKIDLIKILEGDNPPDIVPWANMSTLQIAEKKGLLLDLLQLGQLSGSKKVDINQQILDLATVNGKLLVMPYAATPNVVRYIKGIFDEAHIPYPQGDWTWEQFRNISKKLKPTAGSVLTYDHSTLDLLMSSTGKGMLSPNGVTSVGYLDSPEAIRTIQWLNAYYHDDKAKTAPMDVKNIIEFSSFQTGMVILRTVDSVWKKEDEDKVGVAPLPHFEGGIRANPIGIFGFGISQKSKHPEAALKFIDYLTLTKNEDSIKFAKSFLPTSKEVVEAMGQSTDLTKSIAVEEMIYSVKPSYDYNPFFNQAWNEDLTAQFQKLLTTDDKDIPAKLHDLALKLDQEMNRLKSADEEIK
jgi:multiple sugar transport system substrate-binding protein